ncbi:hypothetical protein FHX74_000433 [Friedmanniella endophytica]|uniref:Uncharacterized protein n=1 Tax=Microlunatus kandeliicorticis TaxID=1759536 RepID=A0A7W3P4E3_9ACTN|nr:hypothetical protein [Microlunatus kandeliicorticis]MBA8792839.1 hypothetical protein [Microlunatus kandeliicorticis]
MYRWISEGRTYRWMVEQYAEKYNVETTTSMFSEIRRKRGMDPRAVRDLELIPWIVQEPDREHADLMCLRWEARRRAGAELTEAARIRLTGWLKGLAERGQVIAYDPDIGFRQVARRPGIDLDIIRHPDQTVPTRKA